MKQEDGTFTTISLGVIIRAMDKEFDNLNNEITFLKARIKVLETAIDILRRGYKKI